MGQSQSAITYGGHMQRWRCLNELEDRSAVVSAATGRGAVERPIAASYELAIHTGSITLSIKERVQQRIAASILF